MLVFVGQSNITWLFTIILKIIYYLVYKMEILLMGLRFNWITKEKKA